MGQFDYSQGYPSVSQMQAELAVLGFETPIENDPNWMDNFTRMQWQLVNATRWAWTLSVYPVTATTFNVRGGRYLWTPTSSILEYTPAAAIDPTDNGTTYVWMASGNTLGTGAAWPAGDHIPLAEVDVDAVGLITAIRDQRVPYLATDS